MIVPRIGLPVDASQWIAVAIGAATIAWGARIEASSRRNERRAVVVLAAVAALLSWGYVAFYLRGGPRIIDATSYYLSARGLAEGHVTFPAPDPETSVLGRFLVRSEDASGARAAVLFPPGYPLVLAAGFLLGAPMLIGPLLAAALVLATCALASEVTRGSSDLKGVPLTSAALSVTCAALRYHTADTMSHGLAALLFTLAVTCLLRARRLSEHASPSRGWRAALLGTAHGNASIAGFCGGWLFATRPASGLAFALTTIAIFSLRGAVSEGEGDAPIAFVRRAKMVAFVALGSIPFVIVYLVHQRLATGLWLVSTHAAHYALNDGPAGCFRYGFGEGIGCYGEHADFVRANLPRGFGLVPAIKTTARRLWMHLVDPANAEPLALLVPAGAWLAWRRPSVRAIAIATALLMAAYVPFYFDGNYPGGGARLFADALPFEHVLVAIAATQLLARGAKTATNIDAAPSWKSAPGASVVGLVLIAFGVRAGFDHARLRDRDGGAPLFSEAEVRAKHPGSGLLFVDTDAAFNLGFDPDARDKGALHVARTQGPTLDRLAWIDRGSPSFTGIARFVTDPSTGRGRVEVTPYSLDRAEGALAIDAGSLWPPRAQQGGAFALPTFASGTCARAARPLRVLSTEERGAVRVGVPAAFGRGREMLVTLLFGGAVSREVEWAGAPSIEVAIHVDGAAIARQVIASPGLASPSCARGAIARISLSARQIDVVVTPLWHGPADPERQPLVAIDRVEITDDADAVLDVAGARSAAGGGHR